MRDILFRGKRADNGEWVYGYLIQYNERHYIYYQKPDEMCQTGDWLTSERVIPETVGQYTGLTDKNGKKIFEGDILKVPNWDCYGNVVYSVPECRFEISMQNGHWVPMHDFASDVEVIGNIHDNPELLKGDEKSELEKNCNRKTKRL